jgi:hypothetical protein
MQSCSAPCLLQLLPGCAWSVAVCACLCRQLCSLHEPACLTLMDGARALLHEAGLDLCRQDIRQMPGSSYSLAAALIHCKDACKLVRRSCTSSAGLMQQWHLSSDRW